MKTYAEKYHKRERFKDVNLQDIGVIVWTPFSNIKEEWREELCNLVWCDDIEYYDDNEDEYVDIYLNDLGNYCIDTTNYQYCMGSDFDEWLFKDYIKSLIKDYNHYLVCAYHSNWLGQTGYKIADEIEDCFYRGYACSQYVSGSSKGGKSLLITEYSHDVPMGHSTVIIGLTDKEFEKIDYEDRWGYFENIIDFADRKSKSIIEF